MSDQGGLFPDEVIEAEAAPRPLNRNGRPKGARNLRHYYLEKLAKENSIALVRSVMAAAIAGDMTAAKIILDRVWPRPRTAPIAVDLPVTETPADIRDAMTKLLTQTFHGEISTDDAAAVMSMLKVQLESHSIRTVEGPVEAAGTSDAREQLFAKLKVAMERRTQEGANGATIQ